MKLAPVQVYFEKVLFSGPADQKVESSLLVEWNSGVVCGQHRIHRRHPIFINQTGRCSCKGRAGAGGSLGGRKKKRETKSHLASMRAGNSVTLRMCVVILPAAVEAGGVTLANQPPNKNRETLRGCLLQRTNYFNHDLMTSRKL